MGIVTELLIGCCRAILGVMAQTMAFSRCVTPVSPFV